MVGFSALFAGKMQAILALVAVGILIKNLAVAAFCKAADFAFLFKLGKIAINGAYAYSLTAECILYLPCRQLLISVQREK